MRLSLGSLRKIVRGFEKSANISNADVAFEIGLVYRRGSQQTTFSPQFKNITTLRQLADLCESNEGPVLFDQLLVAESDNQESAKMFVDGLRARGQNLVRLDNLKAAKVQNPAVKFWPGSEPFGVLTDDAVESYTTTTAWGAPSHVDLTTTIVCPPVLLNGQLILRDVHEVMENGVNYRILIGTFDTETETDVEGVFVVTPEHRAYNYIDKNHSVFFVRKDSEWQLLITNNVGLDACYVLAGYSLNEKLVADSLVDGLFLRSGPGVRMLGLKAEQWAGQSKYAGVFALRKEMIRKAYESDAQNMLISKLLRDEVQSITINEITFTKTKAEYNTITVEADGLTETVFGRLDANSQFDIYQVIQVYVEHVMDEIKRTPLNAGHSAFSEAKTYGFTINGIPIVVSIENTNTRRKVNGHYINTSEVSRVINRAACHTNTEDFNNFVKTASYMTLETRDILANGLPINVYDSGNKKQVLTVLARMLFSKNGREISLCLDDEKKTMVPIRRFVAFYRAVQAINLKTNRNSEWCRRKIKELIAAHAVDENGVALTTEEQRQTYIDNVLILRTKEEKRSLELLRTVATKVKAEEGNRDGKVGYFVKGKKTRYFVEMDSPFRVYEAETGRYVCIVDHNRENMGVGFDGLVARLLMLSNDARLAEKVTTVAALV